MFNNLLKCKEHNKNLKNKIYNFNNEKQSCWIIPKRKCAFLKINKQRNGQGR